MCVLMTWSKSKSKLRWAAPLPFFSFCCRLIWLNPGWQGKYVTSQLSWEVAWLLLTRVCSVYIIDELVLVFRVLLKTVRTLRRCKSSLTQEIRYSQNYMLLPVMVVRFEKTILPCCREVKCIQDHFKTWSWI